MLNHIDSSRKLRISFASEILQCGALQVLRVPLDIRYVDLVSPIVAWVCVFLYWREGAFR